MATKIVTPKLRFKEFIGSWRERKLSEISSIRTGPFGSVLHEEDYADIGTPIITVEHLGEQCIIHKNLPLVSDKDKLRLKNYVLEIGDIVFSRVGSVDRSCLISKSEDKWLFSGRLLRVRIIKGAHTSEFLNQNFKCHKNKHRIKSVAVGQTMASLNTEILNNFTLNFPGNIKEEVKISRFLKLIDDKISQLTNKYELLTQYKKGVMQKIFNKEIRFKDKGGKDFPEWQTFFLKDKVSSIGSGGTPKSTTAAYYNGGIPWVSIADMTEQGKYISRTKKTLSKDGLENSSAKLFPEGTVLYAMYASIGECSLATVDVTTSQAILGIQANKNELNNHFLYQWLVSIKDKVVLMGQQGTQSNLNLEIVKNFELNLPTMREQIVIKDFLNSLDLKIEASIKSIEFTKQYKQGLLQQMFV